MKLDPESPQAHEGLAETFLAMGDSVTGIEHYRAAVKMRPEWWPYYRRLAEISRAVGRDKEASQLEAHVQAVFNRPYFERLAWWAEHRYEARDHSRRKEWQEAETDLRRALLFAVDDVRVAELYYNLGYLSERSQRPDLARMEYQLVPENTPNHRSALDRLVALQK